MPTDVITHSDDERLTDYRNIPDAELLRRRGLFVAEGRLVVRRLLTGSRFATRSVLVTDAAYGALEDLVGDARVPVYRVSQALVNEIAGFNIHRGCLAIGERGSALDWRTLAAQAQRLVLLERVADADNVGSIVRSASAFGVDAVLLDGTTTDPLYRKAIRTSMGASLALPFARIGNPSSPGAEARPAHRLVHCSPEGEGGSPKCEGGSAWREALDCLRQQQVTLVGLTPGAPADVRTIAACTRGQRVALLLGHEGEGLSASALEACDHLARIPMRHGIDSLNVATAAAVALYEFQA
jgi:tRNA G18 (ribose-2'-O)-methylase SpoU